MSCLVFPNQVPSLRTLPGLVIPNATLLDTMLCVVLPSLPRKIHPLRDYSNLVIPSLTLLGSMYRPALPDFLMPSTALAGFP